MTASRATLSGERGTLALSPSPGRAPGNGTLSARGPGGLSAPAVQSGCGDTTQGGGDVGILSGLWLDDTKSHNNDNNV